MMDSEDRWSPIERALSDVTQALEGSCPWCSLTRSRLVPLTRPCMARVWRVDGMLGLSASYQACAPGRYGRAGLGNAQQIMTQLQAIGLAPIKDADGIGPLRLIGTVMNPTENDFVILATMVGQGAISVWIHLGAMFGGQEQFGVRNVSRR